MLLLDNQHLGNLARRELVFDWLEPVGDVHQHTLGPEVLDVSRFEPDQVGNALAGGEGYLELGQPVAEVLPIHLDVGVLLLEAGHSGKSGRFERLEETAREYSFFLDLAGVHD